MATYNGDIFSFTDIDTSDLIPAGYYISPSSAATTYRMRGVVSGNVVYWNAPIIDTTGVYYDSGATTPTSIACVGLVV